MKSIAVLLTVFNRREKTLQCLRNLFAQKMPHGYTLDAYLTDDGCTDGTPEAVTEQFPQVHIIKGDGNLFWNRGMYVAWEAATKQNEYDYYLWLNDDTFAYGYMVESLLELSNDKNNNAIIVGATQSTNHSRQTYGGRFKDGKLVPVDGTPRQAISFNGNIVLVPRHAYQILGNLDYYFSHSKGDFDYGLRATKAGIEIYQVGRFLGECDLHTSLDKWCDPAVPFAQRWTMLNRPNGMPPKETFYFNRRHIGLNSAIIHYFSIYMRCFVPNLWHKRNKELLNNSTNE